MKTIRNLLLKIYYPTNSIKMEVVILKCRPNEHFHFGVKALDENMGLDNTSVIPHSDTIFSAIIKNAAKFCTDEQIQELLNAFKNGDILISSGFYCIDYNKQFIFFLPKPLSSSLYLTKNYKQIRKIEFLSKKILENGITAEDWLNPNKCTIIQDRFVILNDELPKEDLSLIKTQHIYTVTSSPKVKVHTDAMEDTLYNRTDVEIGKLETNNSGAFIHFYFIQKVDPDIDTNTLKLYQTSLQLITDTGLGGELSVGCGKIEKIELSSFIEPINNDNKYFLTLSLTAPRVKEQAFYSYYDLISRGGRNIGYGNKYLQTTRFICEGSIVNSNQIEGDIIDISPKNGSNIPYLRNGKAFVIPLHKNYEPHEN